MKLDIMFSKDGNAPFSTADSYGISVNKQTLPESCKRSEFQVKIKINRANSNAREASVALGGLHGPRGSHQEAEAQRDGARHAEGEPGRASGKTHSLNLSRILLRRLTVDSIPRNICGYKKFQTVPPSWTDRLRPCPHLQHGGPHHAPLRPLGRDLHRQVPSRGKHPRLGRLRQTNL